MSNDGVHADPRAVRQLARDLQQFEQKLNALNRETQNAINRASWHDTKKEQFAAQYRDFQRQTNRFVEGRVREFVKSLNAFAGDLEQARNRRF
jgi:hypothetical protein